MHGTVHGTDVYGTVQLQPHEIAVAGARVAGDGGAGTWEGSLLALMLHLRSGEASRREHSLTDCSRSRAWVNGCGSSGAQLLCNPPLEALVPLGSGSYMGPYIHLRTEPSPCNTG